MSFFKKLFGSKGHNSKQEKASSLDMNMEEVKKSREGYVSLGRSIFPVIKDENDQRIIFSQSTPNSKLITAPIADGILKCYVLDTGNQFEMLSESHLKQFNLERDMVERTAMRNLVDKFNERNGIMVQDFSKQIPDSKPFYKIDMDANYPPSMMLVDEFWETTAKSVVKSDLIAVSIPAKNLLFFSDFRTIESFRTMKPVAEQLYEASIQDNLHLTKNTYVRKNGKWIKFEDSLSQMNELL